MKEVRQLTQEISEKLTAFLATEEVKHLIENTKAAAADNGTFTGLIISTEHEDRQGEIVLQDGMDASRYMENPVVLNSHNYYGIESILGLTTKLYRVEVNGVKATAADGIWAPTDAGQMARKLNDAGFQNAQSIGFIAQEYDKVRPNVITRSQLLEWSLVPVPANGFATRLRSIGLTAEAVRAKGFEFKTDGVEPEEQPAPAPVPEPTPAPEAKPEAPAAEPQTTEQVPAEQKDAQQIGAILAELQNTTADAIVRASQLILDIVSRYGENNAQRAAIVEALKAFTTTQKEITGKFADLGKRLGVSEGEETAGEPAPQQRSEATEAADMKDLNEFLMTRTLLRSVVTAGQSALERLNERAREHKASR